MAAALSRTAATAIAVAALLAAGCAAPAGAGRDAAPPATTAPTGSTTTIPPTTAPDARATTTTTGAVASDALLDFEGARDHRSVAPPVAVRIPAIAVDAPLDPLHRNPDGTIQLPAWDRAGWWAGGPKPGQPGPAVVLGHVDSASGPAVFRRLGELRPGDVVEVVRADGSVVRFAVDRLERHPKAAFPTTVVYGPSLEPGLRLVTCGGDFDRSTGHYRDNVVAFADPVP